MFEARIELEKSEASSGDLKCWLKVEVGSDGGIVEELLLTA